jgi:transcriptional regulator with XRE-family HTH domain
MNSTEEWMLRPGGLAVRLREIRDAADLTGAALAAKLGWIQPKISKIETGKQLPTVEDVRAWAMACGADDDTAQALLDLRAEARTLRRRWNQMLRGGQAEIQRTYGNQVQDSTVIRNVEVTTVPGLLQTSGYARAQIVQGVVLHDFDPDEVDAAVEARMARQAVLYDTSKRFEFVVTEAALRLRYCPREDMIDQLGHLLGLTANRSNVWFGILPFGKELPIVPQGRFLILDDAVLLEDYSGEESLRDDNAPYAKAMDMMVESAATGDEARRIIIAAMDALRN